MQAFDAALEAEGIPPRFTHRCQGEYQWKLNRSYSEAAQGESPDRADASMWVLMYRGHWVKVRSDLRAASRFAEASSSYIARQHIRFVTQQALSRRAQGP